MEEMFKTALKTTIWCKLSESAGRGEICEGQGYSTDKGRVFVKRNSGSQARCMFDGEAASLEAIAATNTVCVPKPIMVLDNPEGGAVFVMEYVDMCPLSEHSECLGEQVARLHLHNEEVGRRLKKQDSSVHKDQDVEYVDQFGFPITTCCGVFPQDNSWEKDWATFFVRKLQNQMDLIEKDYHDREAHELWQQVIPRIPGLFKDIEVKPALLHGDLHSGNVGETPSGPLILDPASFYGHHEFELNIAVMFGGLSRCFFDAYHKLIPKAAPGFTERSLLYNVFNYVNHWNHFGTKYRSQSINVLRQLINSS